MNFDLLLGQLRKQSGLDDADCAVFASKLRPAKFKRRESLLQQGQVSRDAAFVLSGCMRAYSLDDNGFEHVLQFAPPGWWITDMYSWISKKESNLCIEAIKDAQVALLSRDDQLELFDRIPKLERYFRILAENALVSTRTRLMENMSLTAKQRYHIFLKTYPNLGNDIPQKLIASYIGVTPEFLSKIRGEK
jgi:CRP-like cAMP-binding protein